MPSFSKYFVPYPSGPDVLFDSYQLIHAALTRTVFRGERNRVAIDLQIPLLIWAGHYKLLFRDDWSKSKNVARNGVCAGIGDERLKHLDFLFRRGIPLRVRRTRLGPRHRHDAVVLWRKDVETRLRIRDLLSI